MAGKSNLRAAFRCADDTPETIALAVKTLSSFYPALKGGKNARVLRYKEVPQTKGSRVKVSGKDFIIEYTSLNVALRMTGNVLSGTVSSEAEKSSFTSFGIMLDCSRNAVPKVPVIKRRLAALALMGHNLVMFYTEDTYAIEGERNFGYMRGRFSAKEVRELDDFCFLLGMELVPCIQTLGHLSCLLRWPDFGKCRDTSDILLAEADETYELIGKMIDFWKKNVRTRRIHVGMDETHHIGRGRYYDLHGDVDHTEIYCRHLKKVASLCRKAGMEPMIWSDMFFRLGSKNNDYYDKEAVITERTKKLIPENVSLVYWDYYHDDEEFYAEWIRRHRKDLGREPLMASGVWTWGCFWYHKDQTESTVIPCIKACRKEKVKELFFTMWGDDGAYCDFSSAMAGLLFASELAFKGEVDTFELEKKYASFLDGASYKNVLAAHQVNVFRPQRLLWDDPVMNICTGSCLFKKLDVAWYDGMRKSYGLAKKLAKMKNVPLGGDLAFAAAAADACEKKFAYVMALFDAWAKKDRARMTAMKKVIPLLEAYKRSFKRFEKGMDAMWKRNNKFFGLETLQIRNAGQLARVKEMLGRLKAFAKGEKDVLPELDELFEKGDYVSPAAYTYVSHGTVII